MDWNILGIVLDCSPTTVAGATAILPLIMKLPCWLLLMMVAHDTKQ